MPSDFRHVSSKLLRRILEQPPRQVPRHDLQSALRWSLEALGADAINVSVPEATFEARREAAREADVALRRRKHTRAHQSLQKFWMN